MLSDSEILDEKTQSLDEALQLLEANRPDDESGPVSNTTRDVQSDSQLSVAVECLNILADLHTTISTEGVSSYDVQTLRSVQAKMAGIQLSAPTKVALERYEGMFTQDRSGVNQTVSVEAAKFEFWKTVKEWFYKLVDFIIDLVKWCKQLQYSETSIRNRYQRVNKELEAAKTILRKLEKDNALGDRDLKPKFKQIQENLLKDPKLTRCKLTLMGFGPSPLNVAFDKELRQVQTFGKVFATVTSDLATVLEGGQFDQANTTFVGRVIDDAIKELETFAVEDPNTDYFINAPELKDLALFNPKYMLTRKLYYMDIWMDLLNKSIADLRKIKRFDKIEDDAAIERVRGAILDLTTGVKAIERVVELLAKLQNCYFKVSATYINYMSKCYEIVREDYEAHALDDLQRAVLAKVDKEWDELMDRMGFM